MEPSEERIKQEGKKIIGLVKAAGIFGKDPGKWQVLAILSPKEQSFIDREPVSDFAGVVFVKNTANGAQKYFQPPDELDLEP